jgi:hypothetical protein
MKANEIRAIRSVNPEAIFYGHKFNGYFIIDDVLEEQVEVGTSWRTTSTKYRKVNKLKGRTITRDRGRQQTLSYNGEIVPERLPSMKVSDGLPNRLRPQDIVGVHSKQSLSEFLEEEQISMMQAFTVERDSNAHYDSLVEQVSQLLGVSMATARQGEPLLEAIVAKFKASA